MVGKRTVLASILVMLVLLLSAANLCFAFPTNAYVAWNKTYPGLGDIVKSVRQTQDGGYIFLSSNYPYPNLNDFSGVFNLVKVDASGQQQWNKTYPGTIFDIDGSQWVIQTSDGGYAAVAWYRTKYLLLKTDQLGNEQWNQTYTASGSCAASGLIQTSDGGFALIGVSNYDPLYGTQDTVWLTKTDSHGNAIWNQTLGSGEPTSIIQTADNGFAIANDYNFQLLKVDSNGNLQVNKTYGNWDKNGVFSVVQTSDGGYALGGYMWRRVNGGDTYFAILKTDSTGNMQRVQYYGTGVGWPMIKTNEGGFATTGWNKLIKADANGTLEWTIATSGQAVAMTQTQDGGIVIAGQSNLVPWLSKINGVTIPSPTVTVTPSPTVPEFPATLAITFLLMTALTVAVMLRKFTDNRDFLKHSV
jgi:hypothetical protein